jgi:Rieske Fe-S protein
MEREHASRRDVVKAGLAAVAALACDGCGLFGSRKPDVVIEPADGLIDLGKGRSATLLRVEGSLLVRPGAGADKIVVVHGRDGNLYAVTSVCTHKGCDVLYDKDLGHLRCPCHGSEYSLDGHNIKGPAKRPLKPYNVTVRSGRIVIEL